MEQDIYSKSLIQWVLQAAQNLVSNVFRCTARVIETTRRKGGAAVSSNPQRFLAITSILKMFKVLIKDYISETFYTFYLCTNHNSNTQRW